MTQVYGTLRVAPGDEDALSVVIDAPPMNLIGPELVRDLVTLLGELESGQETRVVVLESADLDAFVARLARRIASFPADGVRTAKRVLNELTMPKPVDPRERGVVSHPRRVIPGPGSGQSHRIRFPLSRVRPYLAKAADCWRESPQEGDGTFRRL